MKKVSIILPCYNGEKTLRRALNGILNQTYRPIQLILVNDGSTDASHKIATEMRKNFEVSGIEYVYIQQENKGLGGAINTGLKKFDGDYLAWVDADDELLPQSVQIRVDFLESHPEFGSVSSNAYFVDSSDWSMIYGLLTNEVHENSLPNQFENLMFGKSILCSGCHLIKTEVFLKANPLRNIYEAKHGQNLQMLLPVYYTSAHGFINEPLYKYGIGQHDSMTSQIKNMTIHELYIRRQEYIDIVFHTLDQIEDLSKKQNHYYKRKYSSYIMEKNLYDAIEKNDSIYYLKSLRQLIFNRNMKFSYFAYPLRRLFSNILRD